MRWAVGTAISKWGRLRATKTLFGEHLPFMLSTRNPPQQPTPTTLALQIPFTLITLCVALVCLYTLFTGGHALAAFVAAASIFSQTALKSSSLSEPNFLIWRATHSSELTLPSPSVSACARRMPPNWALTSRRSCRRSQ